MKIDIARQPLVPAFVTLFALAVTAMWGGAGDCVSADAPETIPHFFLLPLQLLFIVAMLQLASTAGSCHRTFRFHAERRRLYNF